MVARIIPISTEHSCVDPAQFTPAAERERRFKERVEQSRSISLNAIEWAAGHLKQDAEALAHHVRLLDNLPNFETKAEAAAEEAEAELTAALRIVEAARKSLAKKRIA